MISGIPLTGREHELKTWPLYFEASWRGVKDFEFRKNDRRYCTGDVLYRREWSPESGYSGRWLRSLVTYVLDSSFPEAAVGVPDGYCVMSVRELRRSS